MGSPASPLPDAATGAAHLLAAVVAVVAVLVGLGVAVRASSPASGAAAVLVVGAGLATLTHLALARVDSR